MRLVIFFVTIILPLKCDPKKRQNKLTRMRQESSVAQQDNFLTGQKDATLSSKFRSSTNYRITPLTIKKERRDKIVPVWGCDVMGRTHIY